MCCAIEQSSYGPATGRPEPSRILECWISALAKNNFRTSVAYNWSPISTNEDMTCKPTSEEYTCIKTVASRISLSDTKLLMNAN